MPQFLASQAIPLRVLIVKFICSRAILCFTALVIAIACRLMIDKPFRWYEGVAMMVVLALWPRIELLVHAAMHNAKGTQLYERHMWHHNNPDDDSAVGPISTMLIYHLPALPFLYLNWAVGATLVIVVMAAITTYEFIHFSTHFRYRPKTVWGQRIRRNHLLHHRQPSKFHEVVFPRRKPLLNSDREAEATSSHAA